MAQTDRLHSFRIRASAADLADWQRAADRHSMSRTHWLRQLAAEAAHADRDPATLAAAVLALRRELSACGNNLNQIAHRLNAGHESDPARALSNFEARMSDLTDLLSAIRPTRRRGGGRKARP